MANKSSQGYRIHAGVVRLLISGSGQLQQKLLGLDEVKFFTLVDKSVPLTADRDMDTKSNFTSQHMKLRISTNSYGGYFNLSRIILFIKPVAEAYPG